MGTGGRVPACPATLKHRPTEYFTTAVLLSVSVDVGPGGVQVRKKFEVFACNFQKFGIFLLEVRAFKQRIGRQGGQHVSREL